MKNFYLLFVGLLLSVTSTQANVMSNQSLGSENGLTNRYRYAQPIQFVERGVEFFVFLNGEFDFNTHPVNYRRARRSTVNRTFGAPRVHARANRNIGVRVEHDFNGRVRRIGHLFINYDRFGRVKRIGSIYMRYNRRHGTLKQIGGLQLQYNRWGRLVGQFGSVKPLATCGTNGIDQGTIHIDDGFQNGHDVPAHDEDLYYYRKEGGTSKFNQ
jgi:hypothetical protein